MSMFTRIASAVFAFLASGQIAQAGFFGTFDPGTPIPEPSTLSLVGLAIGGVAFARYLSRKKK